MTETKSVTLYFWYTEIQSE